MFMKYMFKNLKIYGGVIFLLFALSWLSVPQAQAATCSQNTNLNFVISAPNGAFIPNAQVTVYEQVSDVNGQPKPGAFVASARTDAVLGTAQLSWRASSDNNVYAIKVQTINNDAGAFWYYNESLACGQTSTISETLSGILFSLHNSDGSPLINTGFNIYSQVYAGKNPQKQLKQFLVSLNSGVSGQVVVYLPQGSVRDLNRSFSDDYALEINHNWKKFDFYNIKVQDNKLTTLNYFIPSLRVKFQDASGALFPNGTQVTVFLQTVDSNNLPKVGDRVGEFTLGSAGSGNIDLPTGLYVLGIRNQNNTYNYFWNLQVSSGQANTYTVTATNNSANLNLNTSCQNNSQFSLVLQNIAGALIPGMHFALYEQLSNARGLPIAGQQVTSGVIGNTGQGSFSFRPDPLQTYALKVWDRNSNLGAFWFFNAVRFTCNNSQTITETIPALHIVLRDSQGQLKRNYSFSLYEQEYDADNHPFFQNNDLVANLQTDGGGQTTVYVAPYNTYLPAQSGIYAISVRDSNGTQIPFYNIKILANKDYTFQSVLSGINGELRSAQSILLPNQSLQLYQEDRSKTYLSLASPIFNIRTDARGKFSFEYPAGRYALVSLDSFNRQNVFWNITAKAGNNYQYLKTSMASFNLADPQGQGIAANPSLVLYALVRGSSGAYYQGKQIGTIAVNNTKPTIKTLASGTYLAIYKGLGNQQYGQAFYLKTGEFYVVKVVLNSNDLVYFNKAFWLPGASSIIPLSTEHHSTNSSHNSSAHSSVSLAVRLQGRILLQVQDKGQAWYVNPTNQERYALGKPVDAFRIMRRFALGISNSNFQLVQNNPQDWKRLAGRILLKTQDHGRAYYFDPVNFKLYYLGRPADAFRIMRTRALGITNSNLLKIRLGN